MMHSQKFKGLYLISFIKSIFNYSNIITIKERCDVCYTVIQSYSHLLSNTHKTKLSIKNTIVKLLEEKKKVHFCDICCKISTGNNQLQYHLRSKGHSTTLNNYNNFLGTFNKKNFEYRLREIYQTLTDERHYLVIEKNMTENLEFFSNYIKYLRSIKMYSTYQGQKQDKNFAPIIRSHKLNMDFFGVEIIGDGNCFYRSVAYVLFGDQRLYYHLKMCVIFIMWKHRLFFENLLLKNNQGLTLKEFVINTLKKDSWCGLVIAAATTILLERDMYSLTYTKESQKPHRMRYYLADKTKKPIILGFYINHYICFLKKDNDFFQPMESKNEIAVMCSI